MITTAAMNLTLFSAAVVGLAVFLRLVVGSRPAARRVSARLLGIFGMFALAGLYVWLALGPELDARLTGGAEPIVPTARGPAGPIDI